MIIWTTDSQHVLPTDSYVADTTRDWIWDRHRDHQLGVPRYDFQAKGGLPIIAVLFGGDVVEDPTSAGAAAQYAIWQPWWTQWNGAGPYGYGPIPFITVDGNHDNNDDPDCGSGWSPGRNCDESDHIANFPPSQYTYPGFLGCSGPIEESNHLYEADGLNCAARIPSGHGFDVLIMGLSWFGSQSVDWAQDVLDENPGIPVVMTTHRNIGSTYEDWTQCFRPIGEYFDSGPRFQWENRDVFLWLSGHYRGVNVLNEMQEERPSCHLIEPNQFGNRTISHFRNWQDADYGPGNTDDGSSTHFLEVVTIDWDEDWVNFMVYDPKLDRYTEEAPVPTYTVFELGLGRFLPVLVPSLTRHGRWAVVLLLVTAGVALAPLIRTRLRPRD